MAKVDLDRGVMMRQHQESGVDVYMYIDTPGEYMTVNGHPLNEEMAKEAGFDVERLGKEKLKRERMAVAKEQIEKELADQSSVQEDVVEERKGFKLVHYGLGRHKVVDPDGNQLNKEPLSKELGAKLMDRIAGAVNKKSD